jgi:hypothetical protein
VISFLSRYVNWEAVALPFVRFDLVWAAKMTAKPKDSRHSAAEYILNFVGSICRTIGAHFFTDGLPSCLTLN